LRGREAVTARGEGVEGGGCGGVFGGCCGEGHGGEFEEAAWEGAAGGGDVWLGGGDKEADGEGREDEIRQGREGRQWLRRREHLKSSGGWRGVAPCGG